VIVRGANRPALKSYKGGNWSWNNQRGDKNKLKPAPKHHISLRGGINTSRREKKILPFPKNLSAAAACSVACFSSLPLSQQKLNQASNKCLFECVCVRERDS